MPSGKPFDDIKAMLEKMPEANEANRQAISDVLAAFDGPASPIGNAEDDVTWLAGWQSNTQTMATRPLIVVFAGSHGVAGDDQGHIIDQAKARVVSLSAGSAGVRGVAASLQAAFKVFEMGLEYPAADFRQDCSLSERECAAAIAFGMEVVAEGADVIVLGNAGRGSATAAAAMARGLYGGTAEYWAGGSADDNSDRMAAVERGAELHKHALDDPLEILRCFGGRDIAGMVGAILAARHQSIPIILDGFVSCVSAAVLHKLEPSAIAHCMAGHVSSEPRHGALLDRLELSPLLSLGIGVGDGTGGAMALGVLRGSVAAIGTLAEKPSL